MNKFEEWKGEMEARVEQIASSRLPEKWKDILVDRAVEPIGLWAARENGSEERQPGKNQGNGEPATEKQRATIKKHLEGKSGNRIAAYMHSMGKSLDGLTKREASALIDRIFSGDFRGEA